MPSVVVRDNGWHLSFVPYLAFDSNLRLTPSSSAQSQYGEVSRCDYAAAMIIHRARNIDVASQSVAESDALAGMTSVSFLIGGAKQRPKFSNMRSSTFANKPPPPSKSICHFSSLLAFLSALPALFWICTSFQCFPNSSTEVTSIYLLEPTVISTPPTPLFFLRQR